MIFLCIIDWDKCSAIANFLMALAAFVSIFFAWRTRKNDNKAQLKVSIVEKYSMFMLKLTNYGKSTATNIKLNVSGKPIENNLFDFVKETFDKASSKEICLEQGKSIYYLLVPMNDNNIRMFSSKETRPKENQIKDWLNEYENMPISVTCTYNEGKINEKLSIRDYILNGSIRFEDDVVAAINQIGNNIIGLSNNIAFANGPTRYGNISPSVQRKDNIAKISD